MHVYFFSWIFPACTLLFDTARLFIFHNFPRLQIYTNLVWLFFYIICSIYLFILKTIQKCVNFEMNLLESIEKSINVCNFLKNFHHAHSKFFKENSTMHIYFIMHVYYFFPQIPLCMFISSCTFIR